MKGIPENDLQQHYIEVELRAAKRRAQGAGHSSKVSDEATGHSPGPINSIILPNTDNVSNSNREYSLFSESPINNLSSMKDSTAGFPTNSLQSSTSATLAIPSAQSAREASREALAHISRPSVVVAAAPALVMLTQPASHTYANINGLGSLTESRGHHQQSQITHQLYQNNSATDTTSTTENTFTPRGLPIPGIPNSYILTLDLNRSVEECRVDALYSRIHSVLP